MHTFGKWSRTDATQNSTFCSGCSLEVYKKCWRSHGNTHAIDGRTWVEVQPADEKLNVVDKFVYFGHCIVLLGNIRLPLRGGATLLGEILENATFRYLKAVSLNRPCQVCNICVRGKMLYSLQFWALKQQNGQSERAMLLWICQDRLRKINMSATVPF